MKKFVFKIVCLFVCLFVCLSGPAWSATGRGVVRGGSSNAVQMTSGKAANGARAARMPGGTAKTAGAKVASGGKAANGARAAKMPGGTAKTAGAKVAAGTKKPNGARAASTQKVINVGTKVEASQSAASECQIKYDGCMDAFCVMENVSGGRCQCSDKINDLDKLLAEIVAADETVAKMKDAAIEDIKYNLDGKLSEEQKSTLDSLSSSVSDDDIDISVVQNTRGDVLRTQMHKLCAEKMPECASQMTLVKNMYVQKVKSDCNAYENALKQQQSASKQKLAAAQKAIRDAAFESYSDANKYDLGQCAVEYTKCMKTKDTCGSDFTGCVTLAAAENAKGGKAKKYSIKGTKSSVTIAATTMEALMSKKVMCEKVLDQCTNVKDQVWDVFVKNAAPELKTAELNAEANMRSSCLTNISDCYIKSCKDNIDPNDPDGSYDMCLTNPANYKSFCKVQLEPCLTATGGTYEQPEKSTLWESVLAKLSAMRVDSCTMEVKQCLESDDRCGSDYSKCVGLDTDTIIHMCPYDKLMGCQKVYGKEKIQGDDVYEELANMVQGIMLNIDNDMLTTCQNAVTESMVKVCGDENGEGCGEQAITNGLGSHSLSYGICEYTTTSPDSTEGFAWSKCRANPDMISDAELGRVQGSKDGELGTVVPFAGVISGVIRWDSVKISDDGLIDISGYSKLLTDQGVAESEQAAILSELRALQQNIDSIVRTIETDTTVQYCMTGREVQGYQGKKFGSKGGNAARFPDLTKSTRKIIAQNALNQAKENYYAVYDNYADQMHQDYVTVSQRVQANKDANEMDRKRDIARQACVNMAEEAAFAKAPVGQSLWAKIFIGIIVVAALVIATVFTCGAAATVTGFAIAGVASISGAALAGTASAVAIGGAAIVAGIAAGEAVNAQEANDRGVSPVATNANNKGHYFHNEWNYQEDINTEFNEQTMVCRKCIAAKKCKKTGWSLFRDRFCKTWEDDFSAPNCRDIKF